MPPDTIPARPKSGLPTGLLGMIALLVAVEWAVMGHDHALSTLVASNWRIEGNAPARHAPNQDILGFGDSMVKFGLQPKVLRKALGKSTYNFALYCGSAPSSYIMLRRSFEAGARPVAVVVDFQPELLMCDSLKILNRVYPELLTLREAADLCLTARDPARFAEFAIAGLLPTARKRSEIRASLLAAMRGESSSVEDKVLAARRNWKLNKGAEVLPSNPYFRGEVPETGAYPAMFWTPWKADPVNATYLGRFLELARAREVPVFWVLQPNAAEVDARRGRVGYNAQFERFIAARLRRFPNLHVIDGRHIRYPDRVFTDPVHLDRHGAVAYSLGVAEVLKAYFDRPGVGPRWATLPDHRERADSLALEDNAESAVALKAERSRARR